MTSIRRDCLRLLNFGWNKKSNSLFSLSPSRSRAFSKYNILPSAFTKCSFTAVLFSVFRPSQLYFVYFPSVYFIFINFFLFGIGCCSTICRFLSFRLHVSMFFPLSRVSQQFQGGSATVSGSCWAMRARARDIKRVLCTTTFFISSLRMPDSVNISVSQHDAATAWLWIQLEALHRALVFFL